jgi:hypothetical protein
MTPIVDAVAVLGARHGLLLNPVDHWVSVLRFDRFTEQKRFALRAGLRLGGRTFVLPLAPLGPGEEAFSLVDQRTTPCTSVFIGLCAAAGLRVRLTLTHPFRPGDAAFSTTPVLGLALEVTPLAGVFRWEPPSIKVETAEAFIEIADLPDVGELAKGEPFEMCIHGTDALDLFFDSNLKPWNELVAARQHDRLLGPATARTASGFSLAFNPAEPARLRTWWCSHTVHGLEVFGEARGPAYLARFPDLDSVATWARSHGDELFTNAADFDAKIAAHQEAGVAVHHLLAYTLHSWLANTWWVRDWFSVWEGNCYFQSTVDVEYTQSPFYLCWWPELLALQLDQWTRFTKPGTDSLGSTGEGTRYLSHDCGGIVEVGAQSYPHDMEVEETANWIILLFLHWRRTGDDSLVRLHPALLGDFLAFLAAADTTGDGVPDRGVANTIDDGAPAVQFGRKQSYLAAKLLGVRTAAAHLWQHLGDPAAATRQRDLAILVRTTLETRGWQGDHYAVLTEPGGEIINPWTKEKTVSDAIPGWDAAHIYTPNTQALFDLVGIDLGLDPDRVATDLRTALRRCAHTYGSSHSDYEPATLGEHQAGLAGSAAAPGWISMNLLRDLAALYRGIDVSDMPNRYWDWQVTTNSREPALFFETFGGNNLRFYPRGVAVWGWFDAQARRAIDRVSLHA